MSALGRPAQRAADCLGVTTYSLSHTRSRVGATRRGVRFASLPSTNGAARIVGIVLEDEKVRGTIHVAFGASSGIGGVNDASVHIDAIMRTPTLRIGDRIVCQDGTLIPEGRSA